MQGAVWARNGQIAQAVNGGQTKIQVDGSLGEPLLVQEFRHGHQVLQLLLVVLDGFQSCRHRAALGLAFRQGGQGRCINRGDGFDPTAAEAVVLQRAFTIKFKGYGEGVLVFAGTESRRLGEGGWEQGEPLATHTERLALVA